MFLYTDSVTEAVNPQKEMFGADRLDATLHLGVTSMAPLLREVIASVLSAAQAFAGDAKPSDDITMLACRWRE